MAEVYYAHSIKIYGTDKERKEFNFLKNKFKKVCNPNGDINPPIRGIEPYLDKVRRCAVFVCSQYKNHIGRGVYKEVNEALRNSIPVFCLCKGFFGLKLKKIKSVKITNRNDWAIKYGKIKMKKFRKKCTICSKRIKQKQLMLINKDPKRYYHKECWDRRKIYAISEVIKERQFREMEKSL